MYKDLQLAIERKNDEVVAEIEASIRKREKEFTAIAVDYLVMKPTYYNSGCCCFVDGDITGIEIADGFIRLIKWKLKDESPEREVLEGMPVDGGDQ